MWSVPDLAPADVVFLTGAGISANAPTNGPVGYELTTRALSNAFLPETLEEVQRGYDALGFGAGRMPRLEAILEIAARVHRQEVLEDLLDDLAVARPNDLHRFFAEHVLAGGRHLTANFDTAIERAVLGAEVLHFHGSLAFGTAGLGATLSRIERGFPDEVDAELRELLVGQHQRTLVVAGYSGLDFFDMDPFIAAHADQLRDSIDHLIWIEHAHAAPEGEFTQVEWSGPPMLATLARAGVECTIVQAQTPSLLNVLASRWGHSRLGAQDRDRVDWTPAVTLGEEERAEATRRLYLHMGMYGSHARLLEEHQDLIVRVALNDLAEIAWQEGRLDDARKHWNEVFAGPGDERRAGRLERVAACAWDSGAYLRALAAALVAVRAARRAADPEALALCLELQARILVHMSRHPDLRWMVTARQKERVAAELRTVATMNTFGSGVRPRFLDAAELLVSDPEGRAARRPGAAMKPQAAAMWSESFVQYESLSGTLDLRRDEMRRAVAAGTEAMTREWLGNYERAARYLGKSAAFNTAHLLPGAAPLFGWSEGARLLLSRSKSTPWHRLRMVCCSRRGGYVTRVPPMFRGGTNCYVGRAASSRAAGRSMSRGTG